VLPGEDAADAMGWMSRGACRGADPELFFPIAANGPALQQISAAKRICLRCPVRPACLSFGLKTLPEGIWGGTTPEERRIMRKHPALAAAQMHQLTGQLPPASHAP
jgi:WhiB family transcriptional regulator, redox-sensing transcriptional regulator